MATTVITYTRGSTYISEYHDGTYYYGLIGTLTVGGLKFDSLENFNLNRKTVDTVHLKAQDYISAVMYWHTNLKCYVINPWNGTGPNDKQNNILVHSGSRPSDFAGCIGPGFLARAGTPNSLSLSRASLKLIWENCGGAPDNKPEWSKNALQVVFRVTNDFPDRKTVTKSTG